MMAKGFPPHQSRRLRETRRDSFPSRGSPETRGTFDQATADLNGDNVIDILDLVRLRKVLA